MPFLAPIAAFLGVSTFTLVATVASIGYQLYQANKMKQKMRAAEEARKGFEVTRKDSVENLPVIYGENKVGTIITDLKISSNYNFATPANYSAALFEPSQSSAEYYNNNYYFEVSVVGDLGSPLSDDPADGNDILNVTQVTYKIVWSSAIVYQETKTMAQGLADGYNQTTTVVVSKFSTLREALTSILDNGYNYYAGNQHRISNTVYRYGVRRMDVNLLNNSTTSTISFNTNLADSKTGEKKEFLFTQHAIAFSGISKVLDFDIDGIRRTEGRYGGIPLGGGNLNAGYVVNLYPNGGVADNMSTANGFASTNRFTKTFYAAACWKLNRDDPQFNGIPNVQFYVKGQKLRKVIKTGSVYSISETYSYTNNSALIVLDYLLNPDYGRGLNETEIDLESFYNAQQLCNTVVRSKASVDGRINGGPGVKDILFGEFNGFIDTSNSVRDNLQMILDSMSQAKLVWSGGQYKLSIGYPTEQPSVANGLVSSLSVFDDSNIINEKISIIYPNAESKYNQVTVKFPNSYKDFKDDSISWPETFSSVYNQYLAEDNYQPLKTELSINGITDPYHAQAKAEEMVRISRSSYTIKLRLDRSAMFLEPGDYFILSSELAQINSEVYRVETVKINSDLTVDVEAYLFNYQFLAWNMPNDISYGNTVLTSLSVPNPSNVLFTPSSGELYGISSGKLTWTEPESAIVTKYLVEVSNDNKLTWSTLGETYVNSFEMPALNTGTYSFRVKSKTKIDQRSSGVLAFDSGSNDVITIQRATADQVAVVYADSANELTNNQSYTLASQPYVGYYIYSGDLPTLPVRSGISFSRFVSEEQILVHISTDTGTVFRNDSGGSKTLTATVVIGNVESSDYSSYTIKWMYNNSTVYMDQNRNVLSYNNSPLTDPVIAATIPGAMLADSTQSSSYNGSLRQLIVGPEDVNLSAKFKVEIGNI